MFPIGRVGTLEDFADAIAFLVSQRTRNITGTKLRLKGACGLAFDAFIGDQRITGQLGYID
jgi:NAD(P)-dependent dehydrogenase (short-subunit alcohol dehydrogenase family)